MTYGFQNYPIIALPRDVSFVDCPPHSCLKETCPYINYCTLQVPYFERIHLRFDDIVTAFPNDLLIPDVYWAHTGQYDLSEMFKTYPVDSNTCVFAENQKVALRIRKNNECIVQYIGFELESFGT